MQYTRFALWLLALLLGVSGCVSPPDYPDEPVIAYEGISKNTIYQFTNGPSDSLTIQFSFTDGDGDISSPDSTNIFIVDSRFPDEDPSFVAAFPTIPVEGTGNGISGDVFFTVINSGQAVCCVFNDRFCAEDVRYPVDTFSYQIYITDRAGNRSNTIQTEQIQILCLGQ
jgi:hypothetical protein